MMHVSCFLENKKKNKLFFCISLDFS